MKANNLHMRWLFCCLFYLVLLPAAWAQPSSPQLLADRVAYYPRVIRLQNDNHKPKRLLSSFDQGNTAFFYESLDNGLTWSANAVGSITETTLPRNCCSGFYEVPQKLGSTAAGTLFWATSVGTDQTPRTACSIRIYKSTDKGRSWTFFSTAVTGTAGLWEPEFGMDKMGRLVMYFSSEEYKSTGYNQLLAHRTSTDGGLTWSDDVMDVAVNDGTKRPGMAIVRKLPNGTYAMIYEICGMDCDVYIRTSANGYDWGTASELGSRIESADGHHFSHAPNIAWANDGTANGKLIAIGQVMQNNTDNALAVMNGQVVMVNANNGQGVWKEMAAPVASPNDGHTPCPNYSSPLLPSTDGTTLFGIALKNTPDGCRPYYNTVPMKTAMQELFNSPDKVNKRF
jgi:hypothetical protein